MIKKKYVQINQVKTIKVPTEVTFKHKDGRTITLKAIKIMRKPAIKREEKKDG